MFKPSQALQNLPPYLFIHLAILKEKAKSLGRDIIDLGMGNPDLPTPRHIVKALQKNALDPSTHRYPMTAGRPGLRKAVADFYRKRFGVRVDPQHEVLSLVGSKEGLGHLFFALTDPGDTVIIPSPAYPAHTNAPFLSRTRPHWAPLLEKNGFLLDFGAVPSKILKAAKIVVLNYPNNPTGAVIEDKNYLKEAVALAKKYGFLLLYDNAYSEITFDGYRAPSVLEIPGAKSCSIEFNSFSKTYSMAGWRLGYALGNEKAVAYLTKFKSFLDYGVPAFIQEAGIAALETGGEEKTARVYERRRNTLIEALKTHAGWEIPRVKGSMYLWARLPQKGRHTTSFPFAQKLLLSTGVCVSPGIGFGKYGEGFVRISLVADEPRLIEAAKRIGAFLKKETPPKGSSSMVK